MVSLVLVLLFWVSFRPSVIARASPNGRLEARVSRQSRLLQFLSLFGNAEEWLRRYSFVRVELTDRSSHRTLVVSHENQPADAWEDWIDPPNVEWHPAASRFRSSTTRVSGKVEEERIGSTSPRLCYGGKLTHLPPPHSLR